MTRFEFVNKLNGKLYLLSEAERRDIIDEYVGHIALKMQAGKSEAEAIKDFGDIDELAREILDAYHIDSTKIQDKTLDIYIKQMVDYISRATEQILSFSTKNLAYIIVEFVLLLLVLNFIRYPIEFCGSMFVHLFSWLPYTVYHILDRLVNLCANLLAVGISLRILYQFVNQRILNSNPGFIDSMQVQMSKSADKSADESERATSVTENFQKETAETTVKTKKKLLRLPKLKMPKRYTGTGSGTIKESAEKAGDFVVNLIVIMLKVMLRIFIWMPSVVLTIAAIVCTILAAIVYIFSGIGFIGVLIAGVGCCVLGIGFTLWITELLTGGKVNA